MQSILVIGLGRYGDHLCRKLTELGNEVMAVDYDEEKVQNLASVCTGAQIGDCTNEEVLRSLGVANYDVCFVCIGEDFQSSLVITALLKDFGATRVISKAGSPIHSDFLKRNGADEVVYPERDSAEKIAVRVTTHTIDYTALSKEVGIYEIMPHKSWVGKSIRELNFRVKYNMTILATKQKDQINPLPPADYVFQSDEHLMIMGRHEDVEHVLRMIEKQK